MPLWTTTMRPGAVAVRVSVLLGGAAVGGPAGVADAVGAFYRGGADGFFKMAQLAGGAAQGELAAECATDGDAGGVVAAVLETAQTFKNDGDDGLGANVTDDAAHAPYCRVLTARVKRQDRLRGRRPLRGV